MTSITGGCLCGKVRFEATSEPVAVRACWCRLCQALGAGSGTVNVVFPVEAVTIEGPLTAYENQAESGNQMRREFCPTCGTPMTSASKGRPTLIILRAGALDDPEIVKPAMTIWTSQAPSWACIAEDLPRAERQPT